MNRDKICVFASGNGSNLQAIINAIENKILNSEIAFVLSNNSNANALNIAKENQIPSFHLSEKLSGYDHFVYDLTEKLEFYSPKLIVLAGYMKLIPARIIELYKNRIINIHPALLPKYGGKGMFGMNVHQAVFQNKEKYSGISIHLVNEIYDEGKIFFQHRVDISTCSSPEEIAKKILEIEHKYYPIIINEYLKLLKNK